MGAGTGYKNQVSGKTSANGGPPPEALADAGLLMLMVRKDRAGGLAQSNGGYAPLMGTKTGELRISGPGAAVVLFSSNGTGITASGNTTIVSAPPVGQFIRVHALQACNLGSTIVVVGWRQALGVLVWGKALSQRDEFQRVLTPNVWDLADGTALQLNCDVAPTDGGVIWTAEVEFIVSQAG